MSQKRDQESLFKPIKLFPYWPFDVLYTGLVLWNLVLAGIGFASQRWGYAMLNLSVSVFIFLLWQWSRAMHFKRVRRIAEMDEHRRITKAQIIMHYRNMCAMGGEEAAYAMFASRFNEATLRDLGITNSHTNQD